MWIPDLFYKRLCDETHILTTKHVAACARRVAASRVRRVDAPTLIPPTQNVNETRVLHVHLGNEYLSYRAACVNLL